MISTHPRVQKPVLPPAPEPGGQLKSPWEVDLASQKESNKLVVFGRYPRLGKVKTRLEPDLGAQCCVQLYSAMLADSLERVCLVDSAPSLYLAGCSLKEGRSFVASHLKRLATEISIFLQGHGDLGMRMWKAYRASARTSRKVVIMGSDSPSVPLEFVRSAFACLKQVPVVIGPVLDGGYYLIGLAEPREELFKGISWGTPSVLTETIERLDPADYHLLPEWYDIDRRVDLGRLIGDLAQPLEGYPRRTADFLKEIGKLSTKQPLDQPGSTCRINRGTKEHG